MNTLIESAHSAITTRWRTREPVIPALLNIARLTTAAVLSYLLTLLLVDGPIDLTCALTAILVVQTSPQATIKMGMVRVGAVLTGVFIAVGVSTWVGLTWWSLALVIAMALLAANILRLGDQKLETAISAMLILAVGGQEIAVETRIFTTLIGAGVGVAFNLLLPLRVPTEAAVLNVRQVARRQAQILRGASWSLSEGPVTKAQLVALLSHSRDAGSAAEKAEQAVFAVEESLRLNTRALGSANTGPVLRSHLDSLDASSFAVRALFVAMRKEAPEHEATDDGFGEEARAALSIALDNVATCVDGFGELLEAESAGRQDEVERALTDSLEVAREARAILTELLMVDANSQTSLWLLRGSILVAVEQIIEPLGLEDRARLAKQISGAQRVVAGTSELLRRDMLPAAEALSPSNLMSNRLPPTGLRRGWQFTRDQASKLAESRKSKGRRPTGDEGEAE
ncbi:hypothetical protein K0651_12705 [Ornithinimicrobium sp. Arc0846-15]|nr:hypothetical protein [Ornithinimicrobium laminariae]